MSVVIYLLLLHIPFSYAFHRELGREMWCMGIGVALNTLCIFDLVSHFFVGFEASRDGNFIVVLDQASVIRLISAELHLRGEMFGTFL